MDLCSLTSSRISLVAQLKKFQSRQEQKSAAHVSYPLTTTSSIVCCCVQVPDMNALLEGMDVAPSLAPPALSLTVCCVWFVLTPVKSCRTQLNSLSLTTPTDIPIPVSNGYVTSGGWSLVKRPLTPPATDSDPPHRDIQVCTTFVAC